MEYTISALVEPYRKKTIENRRYLHAHPELSLNEFHTAEFIEQQLDEHGIHHQRIGQTGVLGIIHNGDGPTIALRADIDALPIQDLKSDCSYHSCVDGVMHACGHDAHTAALLTTAFILNDHQSKWRGTIKLFFQHSEENGQGARQFIANHCLDDVDFILAYHGASEYPVGDVYITPGGNNASCDYFKVEVNGTSAHVANPEKGKDALVAAAHMVVSLQSIVSRMVSPLDSVIVGVGTLHSGNGYNVIADHAFFEGTIRCFDPTTRQMVQDKITSVVETMAGYFGCNASVTITNYANPLINTQDNCDQITPYAIAIVGSNHVHHDRPKSLAADDMADYLQHVNGCYMYIGTHDQRAKTQLPHHQGYYDLNEDSMLIASSIMIDYIFNTMH